MKHKKVSKKSINSSSSSSASSAKLTATTTTNSSGSYDHITDNKLASFGHQSRKSKADYDTSRSRSRSQTTSASTRSPTPSSTRSDDSVESESNKGLSESDHEEAPKPDTNIYEAMFRKSSFVGGPPIAAPQFFNFQGLSEHQFRLISQFYSDIRAAAAAPNCQPETKMDEIIKSGGGFPIFNDNNL